MIFDITNLDLTILIQALYANSKPTGIGVIEYAFKKTEGLSMEEAKNLLKNHEKKSYREKGKIRYDIEFVNGVPLHFYPEWTKGRLLFNSTFFDQEHGMYKFLEILMSTFLLDEFSIVRKEYGDMKRWKSPFLRFLPDIEFKHKDLLKNAKKEKTPYGIRWQLQ